MVLLFEDVAKHQLSTRGANASKPLSDHYLRFAIRSKARPSHDVSQVFRSEDTRIKEARNAYSIQ